MPRYNWMSSKRSTAYGDDLYDEENTSAAERKRLAGVGWKRLSPMGVKIWMPNLEVSRIEYWIYKDTQNY